LEEQLSVAQLHWVKIRICSAQGAGCFIHCVAFQSVGATAGDDPRRLIGQYFCWDHDFVLDLDFVINMLAVFGLFSFPNLFCHINLLIYAVSLKQKRLSCQ